MNVLAGECSFFLLDSATKLPTPLVTYDHSLAAIDHDAFLKVKWDASS